MARDDRTPITFAYRPALTWVVIAGRCTRTGSRLAAVPSTEQRDLAVTTELTADPRTIYTMTTNAKRMAEQRRTWSLLPDGRLTGSESTTQADPYAGWRTALRIGAGVAAVAAPVLAPFVPVVAAGAAAASVAGGLAASVAGGLGASGLGASGLGAGALRGASRGFAPGPGADVDADFLEADREELVDEDEPADPDWAALGIAEEYPGEHPDAARTLAAWREAIRDLAEAHLVASRRAATDPVEGRRAQALLTATLASTRAEAAPAEALYQTWVANAATRVVEDVAVRFPIDALPTMAQLREWATPGGGDPHTADAQDHAKDDATAGAASNDPADSDWRTFARWHRVVVSVDPDPLTGPAAAEPSSATPTAPASSTDASRDTLKYRPPRPVTVRVWTLATTESGEHPPPDLVRTFHVLATWPGNDQALATPDAARGMAATFGEDGSLRTLSAELIDARLARARALAELPDAVKAGAETGEALRDVFAPPTLQERAAEHEAAGKLGLLPTTPDPLAEERRRLEREELEARIRIAEQLGRSSSDVAAVVHINN